MTILNIKDSVLMIIDVQEKLLNAVFNKDTLAKKAEIMAKAASILDIPVIITEQYPKGLGETVNPIKEELKNEKYFEKTAFSALANEEVLDELKSLNRKKVVIFGIETHICVSQTVNSLVKAGFEVHVVVDACGSRAQIEHQFGLERMKDNSAHLITTEIALFEWLKGAKNPKFKEVQMLIK